MMVDLFAGPGGWDVAAVGLGLEVVGIEVDRAACETREAAGLGTVQGDVRDFSPADFPEATDLSGSPPCQPYSVGGKGRGRAALDTVLDLADRLAARHSITQELRALDDDRWHYDITPPKRAAAVRMGAVEIDRHGVVALMDARRAAAGLESGDAVFQRVLDKAAAAGEVSEVGPRCGNNPNVKLSESDRKAVDDFKAYLAQRRAGETS